MQGQLKRFDPLRFQMRALKVYYLQQELDGLNEMTELERGCPDQNERRKLIAQKVTDAHAAFKATNGL
jgi:hypothetical protein